MKYVINMKYVIILLLLILSGCTIEKEKQMAMKICIDSGGIPIMSTWANVMVDCKFPSQSNKE